MIKLFCNVSYKIGLRFNELLKAVFAMGMGRQEKTRRGGFSKFCFWGKLGALCNEVHRSNKSRAEAAYKGHQLPSLGTDFLVQVLFGKHSD